MAPPLASRTEFHPLIVARVDSLTDDSAAVTFDVPPGLADRFAFAPGQSVTVRRGDERRSYSICAAAGHLPRIGVREVAGGAVSGWLVHEVRAGDVIDVQAPSGSFTPDLDIPAHHVLLAAGSGITPVLSIAGSALAARGAGRLASVLCRTTGSFLSRTRQPTRGLPSTTSAGSSRRTSGIR